MTACYNRQKGFREWYQKVAKFVSIKNDQRVLIAELLCLSSAAIRGELILEKSKGELQRIKVQKETVILPLPTISVALLWSRFQDLTPQC